MKRAIILTVLLALSFAPMAAALEPGDTLWTRTYGGTDGDCGRSVQQTSDGGYIIAGSTSSFGAGECDVYLVKTGSSGDTLWTRTYGGSDWDEAYSVQQTSDGGYIIAGSTCSFGAGGYDVYLLKTDSSGDTLWTRTYGGNCDDYGRSVEETSEGGYVIAGYTYFSGPSDVYLLKTDSSGETLWIRSYGGSRDDYGFSVQQTSDGGYIVTGATLSFGAGGADVYLLKTDSSGGTLWSRPYGGSDYDDGYSVRQTSDGGYIIAGYTWSFGEGLSDVYVLKTDSSGDTLWTHTYGGRSEDVGYSLQQTSDGGYIIAGYTASFGAGCTDVSLIRAAGGVIMACANPSPWFCRGRDFSFKLTVTNLTENNVSGTMTFSGYSGYDCDPASVMISIPRTKTFPPGVTEEYYRFKVPNAVPPGQYSLSVSGTLSDIDLFCCMNTDMVQCGPWKKGTNEEWGLVQVHRPEVVSPTSTSLQQNYPNPFNEQTNIVYTSADAVHVSLKVYDIAGRLVETLVEGYQDAGEHEVIWDASRICSGIYFYRLTVGDYTETKRMMLVK